MGPRAVVAEFDEDGVVVEPLASVLVMCRFDVADGDALLDRKQELGGFGEGAEGVEGFVAEEGVDARAFDGAVADAVEEAVDEVFSVDHPANPFNQSINAT